MKKIINGCYRSIIWVSLFVVSIGCSYHVENYMMASLPANSTPNQPIPEQSSSCNDATQQVGTLITSFHECYAYIKQHIANYLSDKIAEMDHNVGRHQQKYNQDPLTLMRYNELVRIGDNPRVAKETITRLEKFQTPSSTLSSILYLKLWQKSASERLEALRNHACMSPGTFSQTAKDFTEKTIRKAATMLVEEEHIQYRKGNKTTRKLYCKKQVYAPTHLQNTDPQEISSSVSNYLYQDLLPYWGKVVGLFVFHALNTSLAHGKMNIQEATTKYTEACTAIQAMYNTPYTQNNKDNCFKREIEKAMAYNLSTHGYSAYSPKEIFTNLKQGILQPITNGYYTLYKIISKIEYSIQPDTPKINNQVNSIISTLNTDNTTPTPGTPEFNNQVIDSLKLFHNIAYSFGILDLITSFGDIISLYSSKLNHGIERNKIAKELGIEGMRLLTTKISLANFIEGNHAKQEQIDKQLNNVHLNQSIHSAVWFLGNNIIQLFVRL